MGRIARWWKWLLAGGVLLVVVLVGGPYAYIHFVQDPAPPQLGKASGPATSGAVVPVAGAWKVAGGTQVGYRVREVLVGQKTTAVGRTSAVTGNLTVSGTRIATASFTARMGQVRSDESRRDDQFRTRIMSTSRYPTSRFVLSEPIELPSVPAVGGKVSARAHGRLTMRGQTEDVTFPVRARRGAQAIQVDGSIPVEFGRWSIPNPSIGGFVTTEDHGVLEFHLVLRGSGH